MKIQKSKRTRSGGNALIETVLALTVLLTVSMGMVEFGQFLYIKHAFNSAARDGARAAIVSTATQARVVSAITATLQQANVAYNSSWLTITDVTTGATVSDVSTVTTGDTLQVRLSVNYDQISNVVRPLYSMTGQGIKNGKPMTGLCAMIKE